MNKPRLIDANELIKCIEYWYESCSPRTDVRDMVICDTLDSVLQHIDDIPTAYDIQGVVEQLEEKAELTYLNRMEERVGKKQTTGFALGIREAIKIVKGGAE